GRTHFEDLLRSADGGQLIKHASDGGADDGHIVLAGVSFHLGENFVARRQHRVHVVLDFRDCNSSHAPVRDYGLIGHVAPCDPELSAAGRLCKVHIIARSCQSGSVEITSISPSPAHLYITFSTAPRDSSS